jgi:predicted DNA-binding transcriptional regulator YafY
MPVNKLALIRYKAIDDCLRNRRRKWTLDDLIEKVAEILLDVEGISTGVSRRTIQADIQLMRSDKLGYNAPIIIQEKKYYTYDDAAYSITKAPINNADVEKMKEVVGILKHMNGFSYFDDISDMIARLDNSLYKSAKAGANCIQLENNQLLRGLEHITPLYQAIRARAPLLIEYQSFKAAKPQQAIYFPYLLKEYRNRWFLIANPKKSTALSTLALDRILSFQELTKETFQEHSITDFDLYFKNVIGVTKSENDRPQRVVLQVNASNAPYVLTKPIHPSQSLLKQDETGIIVSIEVVVNFELEREILGFGECMKVLSPRLLASRIKRRVEKSLQQYAGEVKSQN